MSAVSALNLLVYVIVIIVVIVLLLWLVFHFLALAAPPSYFKQEMTIVSTALRPLL